MKFRAWDGQEMFKVTMLYLTKKGLKIGGGGYLQIELKDIKLMQFTGFKDINQAEVYAGDIVTDSRPDEARYWPVVWEYGCFTIDGSPIWDHAKWITRGRNKVPAPTYNLEELEVVGNIYQNKDLLQ